MCNQHDQYCDESCIKITQHGTFIVSGYDDFVPLKPTMERKVDRITWTIKFRNGSRKRFSFKVG
jgi:adenylylsulfate reductase, subunit B